jgi:hypothetical protein
MGIFLKFRYFVCCLTQYSGNQWRIKDKTIWCRTPEYCKGEWYIVGTPDGRFEGGPHMYEISEDEAYGRHPRCVKSINAKLAEPVFTAGAVKALVGYDPSKTDPAMQRFWEDRIVRARTLDHPLPLDSERHVIEVANHQTQRLREIDLFKMALIENDMARGRTEKMVAFNKGIYDRLTKSEGTK